MPKPELHNPDIDDGDDDIQEPVIAGGGGDPDPVTPPPPPPAAVVEPPDPEPPDPKLAQGWEGLMAADADFRRRQADFQGQNAELERLQAFEAQVQSDPFGALQAHPGVDHRTLLAAMGVEPPEDGPEDREKALLARIDKLEGLVTEGTKASQASIEQVQKQADLRAMAHWLAGQVTEEGHSKYPLVSQYGVQALGDIYKMGKQAQKRGDSMEQDEAFKFAEEFYAKQLTSVLDGVTSRPGAAKLLREHKGLASIFSTNGTKPGDQQPTAQPASAHVGAPAPTLSGRMAAETATSADPDENMSDLEHQKWSMAYAEEVARKKREKSG